jgi:hypothetical protein
MYVEGYGNDKCSEVKEFRSEEEIEYFQEKGQKCDK